MTNELKLYRDRALHNEIKSTRELFDFKRPPVGSNNTIEAYLHNSHVKWDIHEINCQIRDKDVKIDYPDILHNQQTKKITIRWKPPLNRDEPLDAINLFTGELWIGK